MKNILIDTCFWFALYDRRDSMYEKANELYEYLSIGTILIPYPTLYETINTRFSKDKKSLLDFKSLLERQNFELLDDIDYKSEALELTFNSALYLKRPMSLVDTVLRQMLADDKLKIDYLITFNLRDFIDVCRKRNIEILN